MRYVGPFLRGALPDLNIIDVMGALAHRIRDLRGALTDARYSSYRIVVTPNSMVLKEARRAETYLNLFGYPVDAVILNRILPPQPAGNLYIDAMTASQDRALMEITQSFATIPIFRAPLSADEPLGVAALEALGCEVFGDRDPTEVMHVGPSQQVEKQEHGYLLRIPIPNVEIDRLSLTKRGDELYVDVGNVRREVTLPNALATLEPGTARMRDGMLEIPFGIMATDVAANIGS